MAEVREEGGGRIQIRWGIYGGEGWRSVAKDGYNG